MSKGFESNKLHQGRVISFSFPDTREVERWVVRGRYITRACSHCNMRKMRELYKLHLYDGATTTEKSKRIMVLLFETYKGNLLGLAQMVERPLSMREVPGSTPGFSTFSLLLFLLYLKTRKYCPFEVLGNLLFCFTITSCADGSLVVGAFKVKTF